MKVQKGQQNEKIELNYQNNLIVTDVENYFTEKILTKNTQQNLSTLSNLTLTNGNTNCCNEW